MAATKYCVVLVLLYSIPVTATTTVFHTNCTRPPSSSSFNFVTAPNSRGTLEILWSCLFMLFICTWQVQHLNVPPQNTSTRALFWAKPLWMLITLLAPELIVGVALEEFVLATRSVRYMQLELSKLDKQREWTMTHAFYANMYGFWGRRKAVAQPDILANPISTDLVVLNDERMLLYLRSLPSSAVFITEADILGRAKGDIFLKCIAGFEVFWFIVQVCARKAQNLPISQLEIAVLGFAICTLTSYLLWIKKPQDVSVPTLLDEGPNPWDGSNGSIDHRKVYLLHPYDGAARTETTFNFPLGIELPVSLIGFIVGGSIFGAIHVLAWNLHFPSHIEKILWRTSSIATTAIPLLMLPLEVRTRRYFLDTMEISFMHMFLLGVYLICRLFIVVKTFRSLGYLPAGAFATTWSTYLPHLM